MRETGTLYSPRDVEEAFARIADGLDFATKRRETYNLIFSGLGMTPDLNDPALYALYMATDYTPAPTLQESSEVFHETFPDLPVSEREAETLIYSEQSEQTDEKPSRRKRIASGTLRFVAAAGIATGLGLATKQMGTHAIDVFTHSHDGSPLTSLDSLVKNTAKTAMLGALTLAAPLVPLVYKRKRR